MLLREIFVPPPAWHCRGVGMPRCAEFYTQKPARRKASPGGEAGSSQELTDEVEAIVHHHESVQNCYLRPHPVRLEPDHRISGMTATGSHIDFGFAARGTTPRGRLWSVLHRKPLPPLIRHAFGVPPSPRGRLFSVPAGFCIEFAAQALQPGGRGMPPPLHS